MPDARPAAEHRRHQPRRGRARERRQQGGRRRSLADNAGRRCPLDPLPNILAVEQQGRRPGQRQRRSTARSGTSTSGASPAELSLAASTLSSRARPSVAGPLSRRSARAVHRVGASHAALHRPPDPGLDPGHPRRVVPACSAFVRVRRSTRRPSSRTRRATPRPIERETRAPRPRRARRRPVRHWLGKFVQRRLGRAARAPASRCAVDDRSGRCGNTIQLIVWGVLISAIVADRASACTPR